jgi:hypothetical protein
MPIRTLRELRAFLVFGGVLASLLVWLSGSLAQDTPTEKLPTYYRDVLPILEQHCQSCHRAGGIAPMPFETYEETRLFAGAIRRATQEKSMPPWFADSRVGQFSNDPSLRPAEIDALAAWAEAKSPAGDTKDARPSRRWEESWSIPKPDLVLKMTQAVALPASGDIEYTYEIVPMNFKEVRTCITQLCTFARRIRTGCGTRLLAFHSPLRRLLIRKIAAALTGRTATFCSFMRRGVLRMRGPKKWRNLSPRAPTLFFRCTTPPMAAQLPIDQASD